MLLHIGYHKTATTWLQRHLFDCRAAGLAAPWTFDEVIDALVRPHPLEWEADAVRAAFEARRRSVEAEGLVPVISNEELGGNPHAGAYNNTVIAGRLASLFPDARVIIVIRRQPSMLVSTYKQYVARGGVLAPKRYFHPLPGSFRVPTFRPGHYEYHRLIEHYLGLFGADRVRVLPMEAMLEDPGEFVRAVTAFAGGRDPGPLPTSRVRRSNSAATTAVQRRLNRWLLRDDVNPAAPFHVAGLRRWMIGVDRLLRPVCGGIPERRLASFAEDFARGRYAESNRRAAACTGLPLDRFGYEV